MRRMLLAVSVLALLCTPAAAGPNADGGIIVHTNDAFGYLSDACTTPLGEPSSCEEAITRTDKASGAVIWFLAAFPPSSYPAVAAVYFGVDYDDAHLNPSIAFGPCGPSGTVELPDAGWPGNGAGNSVGFSPAIVGDELFRFYYFEVDDALGSIGPYLCSAINPTGGYASFFDNSYPPREDRITKFGCVKWYQSGSNSCPQMMPVGACCAQSGACLLTTESSCVAPGVWHAEWASCTPNPCPPPLAACCNPDGSCTVAFEADCLAPAVWHFEWTSCFPNRCPQPVGVCCSPIGTCTITTEDGCAPPKIWHGDWPSCTPNPCPIPPLGACCAPNGTCTLTFEVSCASPSVWHAEWTTCVPNPCPPPPIGACCATNGTCTLATEFTCVPPSVWHGEWTTCVPNNCPQPVGACCDPNGPCTLTTSADCHAPGVWHGEWTTCSPNPCPQPVRACCAPSGNCTLRTAANCQPPNVWHSDWTTCTPNPCPQPLGACCDPSNGACILVLQAACSPPFIWHLEWTTCSPNPCPRPVGPNMNGAIIVHTNDAYDYLSATVCTTPLGEPPSCSEAISRTDKGAGAVVWFVAAFLPGTSPAVASIYFGINYDETNLDPSVGFGPCGPPGTAQAPDAGWPSNTSGNTVAFGTPIVSDTIFRFYYFRVDELTGLPGPFLCSAANPTGGYAAFYDTSYPPIQDDIYSFGCVKWYAQGSNPCPMPPPGGVCCDPATGSCEVTIESGCPPPREWHGEWASCSPNPCPMPVGACCFQDGHCELLSQASCNAAPEHYEWLGYGSSCTPDPCGQPGACCDPYGYCYFVLQTICPPGYEFMGEGVECLPSGMCPEGSACCLPNGECVMVPQADCQQMGGTWHSGQTCASVDCSPPPTPVKKTTWGKIKASFR